MPGKHKKTTTALPTESCSEGKKYDTGKLRWDLIPVGPMEEVVKVYQYGCVKYEDWNWARGIKYSRLFSAAARHLFTWWRTGEAYDPESGCHHLASVVFYMLALMHFERTTDGSWDDRQCV